MEKIIKIAAIVVPIAAIVLAGLLYGIIILAALAVVLLATKKITRRDATLVIVMFFVFSQAFYFFFTPAVAVAKSHGTVLSDNWFEALSWVRNNTPECAVVATYWDPGHFITGIARRAVVFDGASQGDLYTRQYNYTQAGVVVEKYDNNINHIVVYAGGNKTTARIQDISTTLLTSNETLAVEILREYLKPGCDSMYYIASSDLIGKSTWWTYFSTWNPIEKKGTPYNYIPASLGSAKPDIGQNAIIYTYPLSQQESFVVYVTNSTVIAFLQQQGTAQPLKMRHFIYFDASGTGRLYTQDDAVVDGTLWIEPGNGAVLFIAPELEDSMFTRMFLYNGNGLQNFQLVNNWGGEVKLFKVNFS